MSCMHQENRLVKIGKHGHVVKEYLVPSSSTIADVMRIHGIVLDPNTQYIMINGKEEPAGIMSSFVSNNMLIIIHDRPIIKSINIKVARVGAPLIPVIIPDGGYVRTALRAAHIEPASNEEIWIHRNGGTKGERGQINTQVYDNDVIILEVQKRIRDPRVMKIVNIIGEYTDLDLEALEDSEGSKLCDEILDRIENAL